MTDLLTLENATNLIMLCFLQAVLGFCVLPVAGAVHSDKTGSATDGKSRQIKPSERDIMTISNFRTYIPTTAPFVVEVIQSGYKRKLNAERQAMQKHS